MEVRSEIKNISQLKPGDIVIGKISLRQYVVTNNYGDRVTAVSSIDITNIGEFWILDKRK